MGESWDKHLSMLVSRLPTSSGLQQQLPSEKVAEQPNSSSCGEYIENDVLQSCHIGIGSHRPRKTIHIS